MANPLYPSLIPRYVDESWFANDQPIDEAAKLNELEANNELWMRDAQYRTPHDMHTPHIEPLDDEANDDDDDDEINEEEEEEDDDLEDEPEEIEEDYNQSESPQPM